MDYMPPGFALFVTAFLGLVLGSFATALVYRLPRGISMVTKARSSCPSCGRDLSFADLVPVLSWLALKGKCRGCGKKIGMVYLLVELFTLALCLAFHAVYGFDLQVFALFALAPVLSAIIAIDLAHKIIPDSLNLCVFLFGMLAAAIHFQPEYFIDGFAGAAIYGTASYGLRALFFRLKNREAMGLGDVKFFAAAGFWLGLDPDLAALFMLLSGALGVALALVWKKLSGEEEFPFGPALVAGFIAMLLYAVPFSP